MSRAWALLGRPIIHLRTAVNPQTLSRVSTVVLSHRPGHGRGCQGRPSSPLPPDHKIVCIWFTFSPGPWRWKRGVPWVPRQAAPHRLSGPRGQGVEPAAQPCAGAGSESGERGGHSRWRQGKAGVGCRTCGEGGRCHTRALRPCWPLGAGPAPAPRDGPRGSRHL